MKLSPRFLLAPLLAVTLAAPVFADDKDVLVAAEKAQNDAPAYRMIAVSTDPNTKAVMTITLEMVKPDLMRMKTESAGQPQFEVVSDGKRAVMSQGGAAFKEGPPQMAAMIGQARQQSSLGAMTKAAQNVKMAGHDTINGVAASVYTFDSDMMGMHGTTKLWVSDKDHRPLKAEGETHGEMQMGAEGSKKVDQQAKITFDYDPSIKITLPATS